MRRLSAILMLLVTLVAARDVWAVKVADISRLNGQRTNQLTGLGLVVGLKGTGDGGDFTAAINPLAAMLGKFADPVSARELGNAQNVAIVSITATVSSNGVRAGDRLDVFVSSVGAAKSLKGGRLFITPMLGPTAGKKVYALAEGALSIEDTTVPTAGVVRNGAVMEEDMPVNVIDNGQFTLVIEEPSASWTMASTIAKIINDAEGTGGETLAVATSPKEVTITVPALERERPDSFISRVQRLPVPILPTEARVQINEKTKTMIITGDVEISPVVISHNGLTITTVLPQPVPTQRNPAVSEHAVVAMDTSNQGGAKLQDLVAALDQLKVPAEDRITIVQELYKTGKLHAKVIVESGK